MRSDEIGLDVEPGRVKDAELEQRVRRTAPRHDREPIHPHFHACHFTRPLLSSWCPSPDAA